MSLLKMTKSQFHIMMLPPELTEKIMYFAFFGQDSPDMETLDSCRKVCLAWSEMIKRNKEWGIITQSKIEKTWAKPGVPDSFPSYKMIAQAKALESEGILPTGVMESLAGRVREEVNGGGGSLQVITTAASMAHKGLLGTVERLRLCDDLTSVPSEHMASLVSSVTGRIHIEIVSRCDLMTILDSVNSQELEIYDQSLGREETEALVRALETRVEKVQLGYMDLDIETLVKYNGRGKCMLVSCYSDFADKYIYSQKLKTWAKRIHWEVIPNGFLFFKLKRP